MGELGIWAYVCRHFDVPVLMVSGDLAAVNEASQFFSGVETASVKTGISRLRARLVPNNTAEDSIRIAAKKAINKEERPFSLMIEWL